MSPAGLRAATRLARRLAPPPRLTLSQWADSFRRLSPESSAEPGRWNTARAAYQRGMMDALTDPRVERVVLMTSARIGKTQVLNNLVGYHIHQDPAPLLVVMPTEQRAEEWADDEFDPMIRDTPALRAILGERKSRASKQRRTHRQFPGGRVYMVGANAPSGLAAKTIRVVLADEVDRFPVSAGGEGDPVTLAEKRTATIWNRKIVLSSTPTLKGQSRIESAYEGSDRRRFWVPCPHCDEAQVLRWSQVRWTENDATTARYHCEHCGADWTDAQRWEAIRTAEERGGGWRAEGEFRGVAGFHLNELYSSWRRLAETARDFMEARAKPERLKVWINTALGETWDEAADLPRPEILLLRRDAWQPGRIPAGVSVLTGATDVQGDRLEWAVWGFDRHFSQWRIATGVLDGDPTRPEVWQAHDAVMQRRYVDAWGRERPVDVWGVDAGYLSSHVYAYARRHAADTAPEVRALDGRPGWRLPAIGTPVTRDVDWNGQKIGSVRLWPVGTWDMKSELSAALRLTEQGPGPEGWPPGAMRFNEEVDANWLAQLLSEMCVENPRTGVREWRKVNARNEAWDLAVYARALARQATERLTLEMWAALERERLGPPDRGEAGLVNLWAPDLRAEAEAAVKAAQVQVQQAPPVQRAQPRRPGGWAEGGWFSR